MYQNYKLRVYLLICNTIKFWRVISLFSTISAFTNEINIFLHIFSCTKLVFYQTAVVEYHFLGVFEKFEGVRGLSSLLHTVVKYPNKGFIVL